MNQASTGGGMAMQETLVGAALAFIGSLAAVAIGAVALLFQRVVRLETKQEATGEMLGEIRSDVKKLLIRAGVPLDD